jgi:hypothetical protein
MEQLLVRYAALPMSQTYTYLHLFELPLLKCVRTLPTAATHTTLTFCYSCYYEHALSAERLAHCSLRRMGWWDALH